MQATTGDRVLLDAKKVGQPRRSGVVLDVSQGIAGARYQIRWDDGHESFISPGAGALIVEGRAAKGSKRAAGKGEKGRRG